MGVIASGQNASSTICHGLSKDELQKQDARHSSPSSMPSSVPVLPVLPVLTLPKLPKLTPGKPLGTEQRQELVLLQHQIQAQLKQQRVFVESIRQTSEDRSVHGLDRSLRAWTQHVVGPDPVGDTPVDDPESGDESKSFRSRRSNDEKKSNSTLGTTSKVYVDFSDSSQPEAKKDELSALLESDELMKRGGITGEDTGEPGIESPKPSAAPGPLDEQQSVSIASQASKTSGASKLSVSNASKGSRIPNSQLEVVNAISPSATAEEVNSAKSTESRTEKVDLSEEETTEIAAASSPPVADPQDAAKQSPDGSLVAPRRPVPSAAPSLKERHQVVMAPLASTLEPAQLTQLGDTPPGRDERRWIEAAVRRMFQKLSPGALDGVTEAFREWKLEPCTAIVKQQSPVNVGPGLCVLFEGVVDVMHCPMGGKTSEKVCTYDRCGQCFGELELFYDAPRGTRNGRKRHWATIATRTQVTLWTVERDTLRGLIFAANNKSALPTEHQVPGAMTMEFDPDA